MHTGGCVVCVQDLCEGTCRHLPQVAAPGEHMGFQVDINWSRYTSVIPINSSVIFTLYELNTFDNHFNTYTPGGRGGGGPTQGSFVYLCPRNY